jgi:cell division protein FtsW
MKKERKLDPILLFTIMILVGLGIVMVYSASFVIAGQRIGDPYHFLKKQAIAAILGMGLMFGVARFDYHRWQLLSIPLLVLSAILLGVLIFPGMRHDVGGSSRWFRLWFLSFQPSELAKLALVMYLARVFSRQEDKIKQFGGGFLPPMIVLGIFFALVLRQPDFGTGMLFVMLVFILLFAAGARLLYLGGAILATLPALLFVATRAEYRVERILSFLNPWKDPGNAGFQIIQSFLAFGHGKLWGVGLGEGRQKLFYLPEIHTDFIFSVIGEELGLIGVTILLAMFALLMIRGAQISFRARDLFGTVLAFGITLLLSLQTLLNMGVVLGLLPTKGSTLPFISYGGTSLIVNLMAVGILQNVFSQGIQETDAYPNRRRRNGGASVSGPRSG